MSAPKTITRAAYLVDGSRNLSPVQGVSIRVNPALTTGCCGKVLEDLQPPEGSAAWNYCPFCGARILDQ